MNTKCPKIIKNSLVEELFSQNIDSVISEFSNFENLTQNEHKDFTFTSSIKKIEKNNCLYWLRCAIHILRKNKMYYLVAKVIFSIWDSEKSTQKVKEILKSNKTLNFEQEFENIENLHFSDLICHFKEEWKDKIVSDFLDEVTLCLTKTKSDLEMLKKDLN